MITTLSPAPPPTAPPTDLLVFTDEHQALPLAGLGELLVELEPGRHLLLTIPEEPTTQP